MIHPLYKLKEMKRITIKIALFLPLLSFMFTSCLKDKPVEEGRIGIKPNSGQRIVEIAGPATGFVNVDLVGAPKDTTVNMVVVRLASENTAENDIQVTLTPDNSLVTAYNTAHSTNYVVPSANLYQIPSTLTVTIPKGQREGFVTLKAIPNNLFGALYAFGFRLTSTSDPSITISGNYGTQVVALTIRNKYDGIYTYKAVYDVPADRDQAWLKTFTFTSDTRLITTGPLSVSFFNDLFQGNFVPLMTPGASGFGAAQLHIVFDANDKVASLSTTGTDARNRQFQLITGGNSRFDPATKTLFLEMTMSQSGFADIPMHIQMIYKGPRP
jgi:hypothetical protein